ncbi:MAG: hypothetical protein OEZ02_08920 [Anaerolineae bacterium]|nr:hypothetical protein [Anaerolineae bacterium]
MTALSSKNMFLHNHNRAITLVSIIILVLAVAASIRQRISKMLTGQMIQMFFH